MTGDVDHQGEDNQVEDSQGERQGHDASVEPGEDAVHAQAEEQPQPEPPLGELDAAGTSPEVGVADSLQKALAEMRAEADRIAALGTGQDQVEAAERFADAAGKLDEQVGSSARAADDDARG